MADQIIAGCQFADESSISMRIRLSYLHRHTTEQLYLRIQFDNVARAGLRNHRCTVSQSLKRMDLQTLPLIFCSFRGVVSPDDFIILWIDFQHFCPGDLQQHMTVWQNMQVMQRTNLVLPFGLSIRADDRDSVL